MRRVKVQGPLLVILSIAKDLSLPRLLWDFTPRNDEENVSLRAERGNPTLPLVIASPDLSGRGNLLLHGIASAD